MIIQVLRCPYCQSTNIMRYGTTPEGKQRYRCFACRLGRGRTFLLKYTDAEQSPEARQQTVEMPMKASRIRDTARGSHIRRGMTLARWVPTPLIRERERTPLELVEAEPPVTGWLHLFSSIMDVIRLYLMLLPDRVRHIEPLERARQVREFLEVRGGIWIKIGQLLSTRRDTFPDEVCDELGRLQDRVPGFSVAQARQIIEEELDRPIYSVFSQFINEPIAAASVAQVHRAKLRRPNVWVAVKVRRPFIEDTFKRDLQLARRLALIVNRFDVSGRLRSLEMYEELERMLNEELELRIEAGSLARMRRTLRAHRAIYSPRVFLRFCTARMLVMEWVDGVLMSDFLKMSQSDPHRVDRWLDENKIDPKQVARSLLMSVQRQFYEDNLFHADLHPGNIMLLRRNRIAMIDFGSVGKLEERFRKRVLLYNRFLQDGEIRKAMIVLLSMSGPLPKTDLSALVDRLVKNQQRILMIAVSDAFSEKERSDNEATKEQNRILQEFNVPVNWDFLRITRTMSALQISVLSLDPECNYKKILSRYFREYDARQALRQAARLQQDYRELLADYKELRRDELDQATTRDAMLQTLTTPSRIETAVDEMLRQARRWTVLAGVIMLTLFLHQHYLSLLPDRLHAWLTAHTIRLPKLGPLVWLALAMLLWYLRRLLTRLQ